MTEEIEAFYDRFSRRFVGDYVEGNPRVARQLAFFAEAIPRGVSTALVVGCGSGEGAHFVATEVAPRAQVLAVDLSDAALDIGRQLFAHERLRFRQVDIVSDPVPGGPFDVILFPDVYEHVPLEARPRLHERIAELLGPQGKVLLTVPSLGHQAMLREAGGHGLQAVDEDVSLEDLLALAQDLEAELTSFRAISVWNTNDYYHALIERDARAARPLGQADRTPLKVGAQAEGPLAARISRWGARLRRGWRRARVRWRLR